MKTLKFTLWLTLTLPLQTNAAVVFDGTVGNIAPGTKISGNMVIDEVQGQRIGNNIFHSFDTFNVNNGESVTFTANTAVQTNNVIGRVTGGTNSYVDGPITSKIPGANLWLINPMGFVFTENAVVDVDGSFNVSTANYIAFPGGGIYDADNPSNDILTSANPTAFGFLKANNLDPVSDIEINGSDFSVTDGNSISIVGGNVKISGTALGDKRIEATGGQINVVGVNSDGQVGINADQVDISRISQLGNVTIDNNAFLSVSEASNSTNGSGTIRIIGNKIFVDSSELRATTTNGNGKSINVDAANDLNITDSGIISQTLGAGAAGDINISAGKYTQFNSHVSSLAWDIGQTGNIDITVDQLNMTNGSINALSGTASASASSGAISITANDSINVVDTDNQITTLIATISSGSAPSGDISITAKELSVDGMVIASQTQGNGNAGDITVTVDRLNMTNNGHILADSSEGTTGNGGKVTVTANESIDFNNDSGIYAGTLGTGNGGDIFVTTGTLTLANNSWIQSGGSAQGDSGDVTITSDNIYLNANSYISCDSGGIYDINPTSNSGIIQINNTYDIVLNDSYISSSTFSHGDGGQITINSNNLVLKNNSDIGASSILFDGKAGNISINIGDSLVLENSSIDTLSQNSGGGNIDIRLNGRLIANTGSIITDANGATSLDTGGDISITGKDNTIDYIVMSNSYILADANAGNGGNITITADQLLKSNSIIAAESQLGLSGEIFIGSPNTDILNGLSFLDFGFLVESSLLRRRCAADAIKNRSSFTTDTVKINPIPSSYSATAMEAVVEVNQVSENDAINYPYGLLASCIF